MKLSVILKSAVAIGFRIGPAALLLAVLVACSLPTPSEHLLPATEQPGDSAGEIRSSGSDSAGGESGDTEPRPTKDLVWALAGRLIIASVDDREPRGVVDAFDPASGERTRLWDTGPETSAWTIAPDGHAVAYLAAVRQPTAIERLIVQATVPNAEPRIVAGGEAATARFSGFAWADDARTIVTMRQIGFPGSEQASDARWELQLLAVEEGDANAFSTNERVIWLADATEVGPVALSVAAWDSGVGRVAVLESGLDGGPVVAVRLIDTARGEPIARLSLDAPGEGFKASSSGDRLAWSSVSDGSITILRLADGQIATTIPNPTGAKRDSLVWSPDSWQLAWREDGPAGAAADTQVVVVDLDDGGPPKPHHLTGSALRPLAFSLDGEFLLVGAGMPNGVETREARILDPEGDTAPIDLEWSLPDGRWGVAWAKP